MSSLTEKQFTLRIARRSMPRFVVVVIKCRAIKTPKRQLAIPVSPVVVEFERKPSFATEITKVEFADAAKLRRQPTRRGFIP
jgi:hypothetical protein